jgi:hypothetical protein
MPGFMPGIHVLSFPSQSKTWMAGTSPAMTLLSHRDGKKRQDGPGYLNQSNGPRDCCCRTGCCGRGGEKSNGPRGGGCCSAVL